MLGILEKYITKYCKREYAAKDIDPINKQLSDEREAEFGQEDETTIKADTIELGIDLSIKQKVRCMFRKHEALWSGKLAEIKATTQKIDLTSRSIHSNQHLIAPEQSYANLRNSKLKKLVTCVIDTSNAEWAALVMFAPKNTVNCGSVFIIGVLIR